MADIVKVCPQCGRDNRIEAVQCICGHTFRTQFRADGTRIDETRVVDMSGAPVPSAASQRYAPQPAPQLVQPIYVVPPPQPTPQREEEIIPGGPTRMAAAALAFFLGPLGLHGFYMGNTGMGLFFLLYTLACLFVLLLSLLVPGLLCLLVFALPLGLMTFIQAVVYLSCSDREFQRRFVIEGRWI